MSSSQADRWRGRPAGTTETDKTLGRKQQAGRQDRAGMGGGILSPLLLSQTSLSLSLSLSCHPNVWRQQHRRHGLEVGDFTFYLNTITFLWPFLVWLLALSICFWLFCFIFHFQPFWDRKKTFLCCSHAYRHACILYVCVYI